MATVRRVIDANEKLANHPDHQASAQQRIIEGNAELAQLAVEETKLVEAIRDDVIAAPTGDTGDAGFRSVGAQLGGNPDIAEPEPRAGSETEPHDQG
jgi:hypothetical protein